MNKKLLAVAVAAALAPAVSQAQVTLSGTINIWHENISASGSSGATATTAAQNNIVSRNRLSDNNGSNIRFRADEDLGNGLKAWAQVETAVISNNDTRFNSAGQNGAAGANAAVANTAAQATAGWATRNSGIGLSSATLGTLTLGIWDIHYHTQYGVDPSLIKGASHQSTLSLLLNAGTGSPSAGTRYSNVIRWDSPNWNGFELGVAYSRPTDGAPIGPNAAALGTTADIRDGKKNTVWSINPKYSNGPLQVFYSYFKESDLVVNGVATGWQGKMASLYGAAGGTGTLTAASVNSVLETRSDRVGGSWTFPFGLQVGLIWDRYKVSSNNQANAALATLGLAVGNTFSADIKRTVWALPINYNFGNHGIQFTYARAGDITGSVSSPLLSTSGNVNATGAKMWQIGYTYNLSKRTNMHASYTRINNDTNANYDGFANAVGLGASGNNGADPTYFVVGLRHSF